MSIYTWWVNQTLKNKSDKIFMKIMFEGYVSNIHKEHIKEMWANLGKEGFNRIA